MIMRVSAWVWLVLGILLVPGLGQGRLKVGDPAPEFRTRLLDGTEIRLGDLRGRVVVLNFWFIACPPCLLEMPDLNELVDRFAGKPVVFLGLTPDRPEELRSFLEFRQFKYLIAPEATPVAEIYGVRAAPVHVVIDPEGRIHSIQYGVIGDLESEMVRPIEKLLSR